MKRNIEKQKLFAELAEGSKKVLDLGCAWHPNKYLKNPIGMDIKKVKKPDNYKEIIQWDLNKPFPFKDNSFNCVIAGDIIEHLEKREQFLMECKRVLKSNGKLIISTPNKWLYRLAKGKTPYHLKEYSYREFKKFLSKYFTIIKCYGMTFKILGVKISLRRFPRFSYIVIYECKNKQS